MKKKTKVKLATIGENTSLKKGGIPIKPSHKEVHSGVDTEQRKALDNGSLEFLASVRASRERSIDTIEKEVEINSFNDVKNYSDSSIEEEEVEYTYESVMREIQGSRCFEDEEMEYTDESFMGEIQEGRCFEDEEIERTYESIAGEIQGSGCFEDEEMEYTHDGLMNEIRNVQYYSVDAEEEGRDRIHEEKVSDPKESKRDPNPKENSDMDKNRIKAEKIIPDSEIRNYLLAREIIRKHKLKRLSKIGTTVWGYNGKSYVPLNDQKLGELIYSEIPEAVKLEVSSCVRIKKNVIEFIRDELAQAVKEGNRDFYFSRVDYKDIMGKVVLQNGVFDIRSGMLEEFDATKPYYYELNANYLEVHDDRLYTPAFDKLISDACGDDRESIQMIMQVLGMLLIPDSSKKFPVVGPASNSGKSVLFGGLLEEILPRERISHVATSELKDKFVLGNAEDMLLISCMDVDMDTVSAATAGVIKRATGEEVISVQDKYKPRKDIEIRFKFVFGSNGSFRPQKDDKGWQNRILAVPFIHETPEEEMDMHLLDKLLEEKDAIVTKVLRAMASAITGEGELQVRESELSIKLKYSWTMPNTCFDEFMGDMVDVTGEEADNYSTDELYEAYCQYYICSVRRKHGNCSNRRLSRTEFANNVLQYGCGLIERRRVSQSRNEHFKNAQSRICGLLLKSADIFDNADRNGTEIKQ